MSRISLERVHPRRTLLDPVCVSCTPPDDDELTFLVSPAWKVVLHPDQTVPGAVLLVARRHVGQLSDLTAEEAAEWFELYSVVERALLDELGADLVNVSCERNWAYRAADPEPPQLDGRANPHVHWHVAPRFAAPVEIAGTTFVDEDFGDELAWRGRPPGVGVRTGLIDRLARWILDATS